MDDDLYTHIVRHIEEKQMGVKQKPKRQFLVYLIFAVLLPSPLTYSHGNTEHYAVQKVQECRQK